MHDLHLQFTNNWFEVTAQPSWELLVPQVNPRRILEIGSYEGRSTCWLIDTLANPLEPLDIHCIDSWSGGIEHQLGGVAPADMAAVEERFNANIKALVAAKRAKGMTLSVASHRGLSWQVLPKLLAEGLGGLFDWIYVDGSHQAPDVLSDAVMAFYLLRVGGILCFDDYLWSEYSPIERDPLRCPKPAIDSFSAVFFRKVNMLSAPPVQAFFQKVSD